MTAPLADIGVNLADKRFRDDRDAVVARAREAGVALQILTGTSVAGSAEALELARPTTDLFATAGVHPHVSREFDDSARASLIELLEEPRVRAVGETGLDFNRDFSPRPDQERAFEEQLALAAERQLPVFLHQRDAHDRFRAILGDFRDRLPAAVVHCFTGSREELFDYLDLDCHIGITGWLCDERRGGELREAVAELPLNRFMVETDSPWLLPRDLPFEPAVRKRNEPAHLPWIVKRLTECMNRDEGEVARASWANTLAFFNLEEEFAETAR
jgi:TatD DNase family protein